MAEGRIAWSDILAFSLVLAQDKLMVVQEGWAMDASNLRAATSVVRSKVNLVMTKGIANLR